jgi:pimeloyl-ACP methyl ester carboxylesterase
MHGNADSVIPFALGHEIFETLTVPKRFVEIEGGDHKDVTPPAPEQYWSAVDRFVDSVRR